ncbi:indole-3-glycerol phosphate synthase TrpC [Longirhabdus pacifica]|uniref:indole-3-glycerol phosphate synthase TrpC n=1 Tax=Longirhabdus pacifica TaxID=2305227 RepID=UPI001008FE2B|nr:indole-3-glycerol phosphate synthase TrpC [Longirhabdus pacifica]
MFLDRIAATKKNEIEQLKSLISLSKMEQAIGECSPCRDFTTALKERQRSLALIAEVKKASPSKGLIRSDFDPVSLAKSYERAGANCISVLTDQLYFQGSNTYLQAVKEAVNLPILRKDFIIDPRQVYEARMIGADAILLIAAMLSAKEMQQLYTLAKDVGMDVLSEVHNRSELETVLELDVELIGINNRDLHTFNTTLQTTEQLSSYIPDHKLKISESGIGKTEDIEYLQQLQMDGVLIGEHFMRQHDVEQAVLHLMGSE